MFLQRLFSTGYMVPPGRICGELPSSRQAYRSAIAIAWPSAIESFLVALPPSPDTWC